MFGTRQGTEHSVQKRNIVRRSRKNGTGRRHAVLEKKKAKNGSNKNARKAF
jgi:hypothetical protein